jgi:hypothetical protein
MLNELKIFMFMLRSLKLPLEYYGGLRKHIMEKKLGLMKAMINMC